MAAPLDAIYTELKRLKLEGVERVYVEESTLSLLSSMEVVAPVKERMRIEGF